MKISAVTPSTATYPFERDPLSYCFVRIDTDEGLVGYGEACDSYGCSFANILATVINDAFAPLLINQEIGVGSVDALADRLRLYTRRRLGDQWVAPQARSAVEIALWDLAGQVAGRSVSSLLGRVRDRIAIYASSVFTDEGTAAHQADLLAPLLERGVSMAKVRLGPDWRYGLDVLSELRSILDPAVELMVDGSEIFTLPTALHIAQRLRELGIMWFEEPLPQNERAGIEELARKSPVAIAYGEHLFGREDALDALRHGQLSVLQPDASICGGISEARQMALLASSYGARVVPHMCAGPVSLAANLHFAASVPAIRAIEYSFLFAPAWSAFGEGPNLGPDSIVNGEIGIPDAPGLGVALDEAAIAKYPYRPPGTRVSGSLRGLPDRFVGDR